MSLLKKSVSFWPWRLVLDYLGPEYEIVLTEGGILGNLVPTICDEKKGCSCEYHNGNPLRFFTEPDLMFYAVDKGKVFVDWFSVMTASVKVPAEIFGWLVNVYQKEIKIEKWRDIVEHMCTKGCPDLRVKFTAIEHTFDLSKLDELNFKVCVSMGELEKLRELEELEDLKADSDFTKSFRVKLAIQLHRNDILEDMLTRYGLWPFIPNTPYLNAVHSGNVRALDLLFDRGIPSDRDVLEHANASTSENKSAVLAWLELKGPRSGWGF